MFTGFDQLPEVWIILQILIFSDKVDLGAEAEVLQRVAAQDAVDQHAQLMLLEINAIISQTVAVQDPSIPFQTAKTLVILIDLLRQPPEFPQRRPQA